MASKDISFSYIPSSVRTPGVYAEYNLTLAVRGLPAINWQTLIIAQMLATGNAAALTPMRVFSENDAMTYFGIGSQCHLMVRAALKANPYLQLAVIGLSDAGASVAAAGVLTIGGPATAAGIVSVFIGSEQVDVLVDSGDSAITIAGNIVTALTNAGDLPVTAANGGTAVVTLTARNKGTVGNQIPVSFSTSPSLAGVTVGGTIPAVAAQGTITMTGIANANETFHVGAQTFTWKAAGGGAGDCAIGASASAACDNIVTAVTADVATVVATRGPGNTVIITAAAAGAAGNTIVLTQQSANMAVNGSGTLGATTHGADAIAAAGMSTGAGDPSLSAALVVSFGVQYDIQIHPYNNSTAMLLMKAQLATISGPMEQRPGISVVGFTGTVGSATSLAGAIDDGRSLIGHLRYSAATIAQSAPYEIAAAYGAVIASEPDPAMPLDTLALKGITPAAIADRFSRTEGESLLWNGVAPLVVGPGSAVQIERAISTYTLNAVGVPDPSLLDITTIRSMDYVRYSWRARMTERFSRAKQDARTAARVISETYDILKQLEDLEIVENVDEWKSGILAEQDIQDPTRLNVKIPTDIVPGLHVLAARMDLILG